MKVTISASVWNERISLSIKSKENLDEIHRPLLTTLEEKKLPHYLNTPPAVRANEMLILLHAETSNFIACRNKFNFIKLCLVLGGDFNLTKENINSPAKKIYDEYTKDKSSGPYTSLEPAFPFGDEKRRFFELELDIDKNTLLETLKLYVEEIKNIVSMLQTNKKILISMPTSMELLIRRGLAKLTFTPSVANMDKYEKIIKDALEIAEVPYTLVSYNPVNDRLSLFEIPCVLCSVNNNSSVNILFRHSKDIYDYSSKNNKNGNIKLLQHLVQELTPQHNDNTDADNDIQNLNFKVLLNTKSYATTAHNNRLSQYEIMKIVIHFIQFIKGIIKDNNLNLVKSAPEIVSRTKPSSAISLGFLAIGDQSAGDVGIRNPDPSLTSTSTSTSTSTLGLGSYES